MDSLVEIEQSAPAVQNWPKVERGREILTKEGEGGHRKENKTKHRLIIFRLIPWLPHLSLCDVGFVEEKWSGHQAETLTQVA